MYFRRNLQRYLENGIVLLIGKPSSLINDGRHTSMNLESFLRSGVLVTGF